MNLKLYDNQGKEIGTHEVRDEIFSVPMNEHLVHTALKHLQAAERRGTHSTKTRAEVSGGGIKPWRQKGTGRARVGSIRSPLWRSGGVIFGPKPRKYKFSLPKRMRKKALAIVLSERAKEGKIKIIEDISIDKPKTKDAFNLLRRFGAESLKTLIVSGSEDKNCRLAIRNLPQAKYVLYSELNIFDVLNSESLLIFKEAADKFGEFLKR